MKVDHLTHGRRSASLTAAAGALLITVASLVSPQVAAADDVPVSPVQVASDQAATSGAPVQIDSLDSTTSTTFANPDGSFTLEDHATPIRVDQGGTLVPINADLQGTSDGNLAPAATEAPVVVGADQTDLIASIGLGDGSITYRWPSPLPRPVVSGAVATYKNVLPDVDLTVQVSNVGIETSLVVGSATAAANVSAIQLRESASRLRMRTDAADNSVFVDDSGSVVGSSNAPQVRDTPAAAYDEPSVAALDRTVIDTSGDTAAPGELVTPATETVTTPVAFLNDSATHYPVTIDPAASPARIAFAYTDSANPAVSYVNDGWDSGRVHVGTYRENTSSVNRAYFSFQGTGLVGVSVDHAELNTYLDYSGSPAKSLTDLYATVPWGTGMTWNSRPDQGTNPVTLVAQSDPAEAWDNNGVPVGFSVGGWITNHLSDSALYLSLRADNESDWTQWKKFRSDPVLTITYESVPNLPYDDQYISPSLPCVTNQASEPYLNRSRLAQGAFTVGARMSTPDNVNTYGDFLLSRLADDGSWNQISELTTVPQPNGVLQTVSFSTANLRSGDEIRWAVRAVGNGTFSQFSGRCRVGIDFASPHIPVASNMSPSAVLGTAISPAIEVDEAASDSDVTCYVVTTNSAPLGFTWEDLASCGGPDTANKVEYSANGVVVRHASATGHATLPFAPRSSLAQSPLYVYAVDHAHNISNPLTISVSGNADTTVAHRDHQWATDAAPSTATSITDSTELTSSPLNLSGGVVISSAATGFPTATANAVGVGDHQWIPLLRYYSGLDHRSATRWPGGAYNAERQLGEMPARPDPSGGTQALYACLNPNGDEFTATDPTCGAGMTVDTSQSPTGFIGYVYTSVSVLPAAARTAGQYVTLRNCALGGDHFDSSDAACEGQGSGVILGYLPTNLATLWRLHAPGDERPSTLNQSSGAATDGALGAISVTPPQQNSWPVYLCTAGGVDQYISRDAACDGNTFVRSLGYIWRVSAVSGLELAPLMSCRDGQDRFESNDPQCEGKTIGSVMGYVIQSFEQATTSSAVLSSSSRLTAMAWAYPYQLDGHAHVLLQQSAGGGSAYSISLSETGQWKACVDSTSPAGDRRTSCAVTLARALPGQWKCVALTYDAVTDQIWLRVDDSAGNQQDASAYVPSNDSLVPPSGPVTIGGPAQGWLGQVARPYVVDRVLNESQLDRVADGLDAGDGSNDGGGGPGPAFQPVPFQG